MSDFEDAIYDYGLDPGEAFDPEELQDEPFDLTQPHVMTALGPIDPGALGFTLPQETVIRPPVGRGFLEPDLVLDDPAAALAELEGYFLSGGRALVDLNTADAGRNIAELAWVAARAPVHIVLATGAAEGDGDRAEQEIAAAMRRELTDGIGESAIRAGVIVVGSGNDALSEVDARLLRAAASAHDATGAPIVILSERGALALSQLDLLNTNGVASSRVIAGHLNASPDEAFLHTLLATGATALVDRWPRANGTTDAARAALVKRLVDAGFGEQLLISGDLARRSERTAHGGEPGLVYFLDRVPLMLMEAGLTAHQVRQLFIENPARALTITPPG